MQHNDCSGAYVNSLLAVSTLTPELQREHLPSNGSKVFEKK